MIKEVLLQTLKQKKGRDIFFTVWSWLWANSNHHHVFYGTMKEICENCLIDYQKLNKAFELQFQWNNAEFEKTVVLAKDDGQFKANYNYYGTQKYFDLFPIQLSHITNPYRPIIVVFNNLPYTELQNKYDVKQSLKFTERPKENYTPTYNPLNGHAPVKNTDQLIETRPESKHNFIAPIISPTNGQKGDSSKLEVIEPVVTNKTPTKLTAVTLKKSKIYKATTLGTRKRKKVPEAPRSENLQVVTIGGITTVAQPHVKQLPVKITPAMKKEIEKTLINACLNIYIEFYKARYDVEPPALSDKTAGAEINALKSMIRFFRKNNKESQRDDINVLNSFDIIFRNWDNYPDFYQSQLKLRQINSNLGTIIHYIKNNKKKMQMGKTQKIMEYEKNINTAINSGAFDIVLENLGKPLHDKK